MPQLNFEVAKVAAFSVTVLSLENATSAHNAQSFGETTDFFDPD
jgi:hypothetical protein